MTTTDDTSQVPPPAPEQPPTPPVRRLERSTDDRIIAGVCGGLGRYFDIDPVIFRVLFAVTAVFGAGFLLYGAAWLFVPEEYAGRSVAHAARGADAPGRELAIIVLVVIAGLIAFGGVFGGNGPGDGEWLWPVLIFGGIAFFWRRHHLPGVPHGLPPLPPPPPAPWPGSPVPQAPPAPSEFWAATATTPSAPAAPQAGAETEPWGTRIEPAAKPPREKSALGSITFSVLMVALGVTTLLDALDVIDATAQAVLAGGLFLVGLALIVGAWIGRSRGLIALGLILTVAVSVVSALDVSLRGGVGDRLWRPTTTQQLDVPMRLAVGDAVLDLTDSPVREGRHDIDVSVGVGQLTVIVPDGVDVTVTGHVALGDLQVFDQQQEGGGVHLSHVDSPSVDLVIDARVGIGELTVQRETS